MMKVDKRLLVLLLVALILRFYRFGELSSFLGDQGRDALEALRILRAENWPAIGPITSISENIYLPPFYYYFTAVWLWLFRYDPVGPAIGVALLSVLSVALYYRLARSVWGKQAAWLSALLLAVSPTFVFTSRFSWNPNLIPLFVITLLIFWHRWFRSSSGLDLTGILLSLAVLVNLHYLSLVLVPPALLLLLLNRDRLRPKQLGTAVAVSGLLFLPLLLFDLSHDLLISRGLVEFLGGGKGGELDLINVLSRSRDRFRQSMGYLLGWPERSWLVTVIAAGELVVLVWWFIGNAGSRLAQAIWLLFWLSLLGLGSYQGSVYEHYLLPFTPWLVLLQAIVIKTFQGTRFRLAAIGGVAALVALALTSTVQRLRVDKSLNLPTIKQAAELVLAEADGRPFNFALLAANNYDSAYRYWFHLNRAEVRYETEVTDQLFVVCEKLDCQPAGNAKYEIALFDARYDGQIQLADQWTVNDAIKIYRYVPE